MSLRNRTMLMVSTLLAGTVLVVSAVLTGGAHQTVYHQQADDGLAIARLLARTASIVDSFPQEMENAIGSQMVVQAAIAAQFVDAAQQAGWTTDEINQHLKEIVLATELSNLYEFWITDSTGNSVYKNIDVPFAFSPDPSVQPQAYVFWPLLTGEKKIVIQEARQREIDDQVYKYVGVSGVDMPRIVQVGYNVTFLNEYRDRVGLARLVQGLVTSGDVTAIRVTDMNAETVLIFPQDLKAGSLTDEDRTNLSFVTQAGLEKFYLDQDWIKVIVPIHPANKSKTVTGAAMVYIPTDQLNSIIRNFLIQAGAIAAFALATGVLVSLGLSSRVTGPVSQVSRAATAVETGEYKPSMLTDVTRRKDELGSLGRIFDEMAREVQARDRRLRLMKFVIPKGVALSAERDFNRLLETIVVEAQNATGADGGSLYLLTDDQTLRFVIIRNNSLGIAMGGTTGTEVGFDPLPLYIDGQPDHNHIVTHVALTGERVNIPDAYAADGFDFSGTHAFDQRTGYHSKSFLTIPLEGEDKKVAGVLQLINARDAETGEIASFAGDDVIETLILLASAALGGYIREERLRQEINKLRIEVDEVKKAKQVAEITETDYFKELQERANALRQKRKK